MQPVNNDTVTISLSVPKKLLERIDARVEEMRRQHAFLQLSRSSLVCHGLDQWMQLLDEPGRGASSVPRRQGVGRR